MKALVATEIDSSNLQDLAYEIDARILCVRFKNGGVYGYQGVPQDVVAAILEAPSPGSAFNTLVRSKEYVYKRIV